MTHLCAKFHQDQSKIEEKIMSKTTALYVYDNWCSHLGIKYDTTTTECKRKISFRIEYLIDFVLTDVK